MVRTGVCSVGPVGDFLENKNLTPDFPGRKIGKSEPAFFPEDFTGMVILELFEKVVC